MNIEEAVVAACRGASVLMCYDTEDESVNSIIQTRHLVKEVGDGEYTSRSRFSFGSGGSITFLAISLTTSEYWGDLHFHEGNALAREIFPGCFADAL